MIITQGREIRETTAVTIQTQTTPKRILRVVIQTVVLQIEEIRHLLIQLLLEAIHRHLIQLLREAIHLLQEAVVEGVAVLRVKVAVLQAKVVVENRRTTL